MKLAIGIAMSFMSPCTLVQACGKTSTPEDVVQERVDAYNAQHVQ